MYFDALGPSDQRWTQRVYAGSIARFGSLAAMGDLLSWVRGFCADRWLSPAEAHEDVAPEELAVQIIDAQRAFAREPMVAHLWRRLFEEAGMDLVDTCRDRLLLRIQPPLPGAAGGPVSAYTAPLPLHRDTWATNVYAQINWWAPVYPLEAGRTMAIHPTLWDVPIANNSGGFDFDRVRGRIGEACSDLRVSDFLPVATEADPMGEAVPVLIEPGEVIAFSAQHAHASVPNRTRRTRVSLETRTVSVHDLLAGTGAPNVDGAACGVQVGLFRRMSDRVPLADIVAEAAGRVA